MRMETGTSQDHLIRKQIVPLSTSIVTTKFNQKDIDLTLLKERATAEWKKITLVGKRTPHQVLMDCYMGQCAELYLMLFCGYTDNTNGFYDVFSPDGREIECKVTRSHHNIPQMLDKLDERRYGWGHGIADKVYIWLFDDLSGDYEFYKTASANNDLRRYVLDDEIVL
tara:strand:+ start:47 stop:550 length:504 start_codon:yes stop_codon:yes gene_type:complete